ncbi:MAG TPA: nucleoside hydrolase [Tepidisphaeraceae bacterium]|jgi:purine nucleosidase
MARTFLIDTDTASDDAVALIMALRHPDVRVAAITVVSGNVPLEQACTNALYTAELCGADVPVYAGASRPLLRAPEYADWFHGKDGLGDQNYPTPAAKIRTEHATDAIIGAATTHPGLTLVTLGPLTNVALALSRAPEVVKNISRCVVMGGNPCCEGNVTPAAEFNIFVDPEAAQIVFQSGMNIEMIGWQLCRGEANINEREIAQIRKMETKLAHFAIDCNRRAIEANKLQTGEIGIALPDPVAMAVALDPSIAVESTRHRVEIETRSELTRGQTVVDRLNVSSDERNRGIWSGASSPPAGIVWRIDIPRWKELLYRSLR